MPKTVAVRFPDELYALLQKLAQAEDRTIPNMIRQAVKVYATYVKARKEQANYIKVYMRKYRRKPAPDAGDENIAAETAPKTRQNGDIRPKALISSTSSTKAVLFAPAGFEILPSLLASWKLAFPAVDVDAEIREMHVWAVANPEKHKKNWARFMVNWLKGEQDKAPTKPPEPVKQRPWMLQDGEPASSPPPPEFSEAVQKLAAVMPKMPL